MKDRDLLSKDAYGIAGASNEDIREARFFLVCMAITPMEILEAYFLSYQDKELEKMFFSKLEKVDLAKEDWKFLLDNSSKFGLPGLRIYAEEKFYE